MVEAGTCAGRVPAPVGPQHGGKIGRKSPRYGEAGYARVDHDAYFTIDAALTGAACAFLLAPPRAVIWEPCAGLGHMARVLRAAGHAVVASDLCARDWPEPDIPFRQADFLRAPPAWEPLLAGIGAIVTNPPFGDGAAEACVRRALALMRPGHGQVAMLLPADFDTAAGRMDLFDPPFATKLVCCWRPKWFAAAPGRKDTGPRNSFAWFFWDWRHQGPARLLYAARPGNGEAVA